jgi:hypothetical protein
MERPVVLNDLYNAIERAGRVLIKSCPMNNAKTLFESTNKDDLDDLGRSVLLHPPTVFFHCMCIGSPAVYLHVWGGPVVELTNHHGRTVRCSLWTSDVRVADIQKWVSWFSRRGIYGPREEVDATRARQEVGKNWDRWLAARPRAIVPVWSDTLDRYGDVDVVPLRTALERAVADESDRILQLLEWFGSGAGPWSPVPYYELAAEQLLLDYPTMKIVETILSAKITSAQTEGAARLFGSVLFQRQRPGGLQEVPDALKRLLWDHVKETTDADKLSRAAHAFTE